jgi:hypothetical protein
MIGVLLTAALAAGAPPEQAPPPREVRPDISLVVSVRVDRSGDDSCFRLLRIGFYHGKPLPAEKLLDCDERVYGHLSQSAIRANRYLVSWNGSVFDLREKKFTNHVRDDWFAEDRVVRSDDTKVTYWAACDDKSERLFTFEYTAGTPTRVKEPSEWMIPSGVPRSPDGAKAIYSVGQKLVLHRNGYKPKPLGTNFDSNGEPVLWLDDARVLTQRTAGDLVTVDLDGKVTKVVTIKDGPVFPCSLIRDPAGSIYLTCFSERQLYFQIDVENKKAVQTNWRGLGHGFEAAWGGDQLRYRGKELGRLDYWADAAAAAPGYLAVPVHTDGCDFHIAVWSAASGEWARFDFPWVSSVLGWVK